MKQFLLILLLYGSLYSQTAGSFDTSFGASGIGKICFTPITTHNVYGCDRQSDGKIICSTYTGTCDFELVRFNNDGSTDTTFGINGVQIHNDLPLANNYIQGMIIQPDDKILVMGLQQAGNNYYWVERLLPNGDLDTSFNSTGYNIITLGTPQDRGTCIALQPDGKILLGGTSGSTAQYFTMIRLTTTGAFDTTFGTNGVVQTLFPDSPQSWGTCIAVQPDGKIVMGGFAQTGSTSPFEFAVARYMPNGTLDTTFGTNGKVVTDIVPTDSDQITDMSLQPDGKIVVIGVGGSNTVGMMTVVRYLPNGALDTSFADNGIVSFSNSYSYSPSVALQTDGKLVFGGGGNGVFAIYRYNSNGTADTTFGNNGFVDGNGERVIKVFIQPDHKIVAGGNGGIFETNSVCAQVVRLNPGTLDIEEFIDSTGVVYPNPTTGVCNLQLTNPIANGTVQVYDVMGRKVMSLDCAREDNNVIIDLTGYPSGVYLCEIQTEEGTIRKKIIKQ